MSEFHTIFQLKYTHNKHIILELNLKQYVLHEILYSVFRNLVNRHYDDT